MYEIHRSVTVDIKLSQVSVVKEYRFKHGYSLQQDLCNIVCKISSLDILVDLVAIQKNSFILYEST